MDHFLERGANRKCDRSAKATAVDVGLAHMSSFLRLDLMICTAYKSVSLLTYATIAPNEETFGTMGCNANHINDQVHLPGPSARP
jgi:hypothetical protein